MDHEYEDLAVTLSSKHTVGTPGGVGRREIVESAFVVATVITVLWSGGGKSHHSPMPGILVCLKWCVFLRLANVSGMLCVAWAFFY